MEDRRVQASNVEEESPEEQQTEGKTLWPFPTDIATLGGVARGKSTIRKTKSKWIDKIKNIRFGVFTEVTMKNADFAACVSC
jgi:hypothetical protein